MRLFERAIRRARVPVRWSNGFNPRPKMSFPLALSVGIAGRRELMELELEELVPASQVQQAVQAQLPQGVRVAQVERLEAGVRARIEQVVYRIDLPHGLAVTQAQVADLLRQDSLVVTRGRHGDKHVDVRPFVDSIDLEPGPRGTRMTVAFAVTPRGTGNPRDILALLGVATAPGEPAAQVARTEIRLAALPARKAPSRPEGRQEE